MKRICYCLLLLVCALPRARGVETLRPEQLKSGMKGYGLSVFKGTTVERFEVEVLGVLKNSFPKQDMILIRLSGANLEKHKVIAGMSGSPIYIDGKLIGALAYGWSFENEPLAGVTPIHNMLAELNRAPTVLRQDASASPFFHPSSLIPHPSASDSAPRALLTPLSLGGFGSRTIGWLAEKFEPLGLLPIAAGGGGGADAQRRGAKMEPGSAIGVQLIRGDFNATAVGTATFVEKNKILAFGHPFFQAGRIEAPAVLAEVHTIMSSVNRSFKMATAVSDIGALVGDWQSCIVADTTKQARMIPVAVHVASPDTGHNENYAMEVIDNEAFTASMVLSAVNEAISVAAGSSQGTTVRLTMSAELAPLAPGQLGRTIRVVDTFFNPGGGLLDRGALTPLAAIFNTPFGHPTVKRVEVNVVATLTRQTAEIKRAYFSKAEVERGERVMLSVVLKPFGLPEVTKTIPIDVPATSDALRQISVTVLGGENAPADVAPPDSLGDYLDALARQHTSTELIALVQTAGQGMHYQGKLLKKLPPSALAVLDDIAARDITAAADVLQLVAPTDWVITGQATVRVPIRQE